MTIRFSLAEFEEKRAFHEAGDWIQKAERSSGKKFNLTEYVLSKLLRDEYRYFDAFTYKRDYHTLDYVCQTEPPVISSGEKQSKS